ncbi:unnamed protein product [Larinioides sclopetarius]|uniref:Uncharacterized protein n=1 Tax=Larinioides sclopetarius TaxID=280406 RepID=A0AAV1ZRQ7_9ARAC
MEMRYKRSYGQWVEKDVQLSTLPLVEEGISMRRKSTTDIFNKIPFVELLLHSTYIYKEPISLSKAAKFFNILNVYAYILLKRDRLNF